MSALPVYTQPGTHLGEPMFGMPGVEFGSAAELTPVQQDAIYASYQIVTLYVVPFMFDAQGRKRCCVFLPPLDNGRPWMLGGEQRAGERVGDSAVRFLHEQSGIRVSDMRRRQFLSAGNVRLYRHVKLQGYGGLVVRHELACIIGFAVTPEEMDDFHILGAETNEDAREYWLDLLAPENSEAWAGLDPALTYIIERLAEQIGDFHKNKTSV